MLGIAVVKTACKIWLKDNAIAADAAVGVVEIIQAKVSDVREQKRVRRLFEDLEERVADNVLSCLDVEFGNVPQHDREAAALAAADTLDKAKLTNRNLFAADLDATRLFRAVKPRGRRFTDSLSQDATELWERILRDCCAYVVEVANSLPGFEVGVFGELLSRQKEIMRQVDQRFDRLPMQLGGAGAETFEPTYLRLVAKQLDKVELFGVTVSDRVGNYPLSVAYVSLSIRGSARADDPSFSGLHEGMAKPERRVTSIEEALATTTRAFIRGEAGSGKTTLLQWLAVRCSRRDFDGPIRDWNDCVPLFIRLRRYSGVELPTPEKFLHDVAGSIAHTMPLNWVHDLLRTGRAVVLVDGVDELPEKQRRRAREWLRELLVSYPKARYVVTSRPAAAAESWLDKEDFEALEIQPMTMADIDALVSHWHAALAEGVTSATDVARIDQSRHALTQAIRTRRHLRMLTVSPLMTAMICALHLDRRMQLPNDRVELYSIALEMLLERRDTEREIRASDVTMTRGDKMLILEDLAYWLVRNGWSNASEERVLERLADKLAIMHRVQTEPGDVLKHLLDRSGLLRMPVDGQIDFVHKTFQEFLAARAAVAADDIGVLAQNAHDDQWREVILMAVAHGRAPQTEELLAAVLHRADEETDWQHVLRALAVGCIQHAPQLPAELHQRLQQVATDLLPPKQMSQAVALAAAGDLVLELLSGYKGYTAQESAATIRMAATIGGDHAMSVIADCANNNRKVRDEVERAWPKFDPERYARDVIAKLDVVNGIRIEDPILLSALKHLPVQEITCRFVHGYGDIDYVRELSSLRTFNLLDTALASLTPVADHPNLEQLVLYGGVPPVDISPLGESESLRKVQLSAESIADIRQLRGLVNIKQLQLVDHVQIGDVLSNLAPRLRLERFGLWNARKVWTIDGFLAAEQFADLRFLLLSRAFSLKSIAGVERWAKNMTGVYLDAPNLIDIEQLGSLELLDFANLGNVPVRSLDFLRGSSRLRTLHIGNDRRPLLDLTPLAGLLSLRYLFLWGSRPVDVSGLAQAGKMEVVVVGQADRPIYGREKLPPWVRVRRRRRF